MLGGVAAAFAARTGLDPTLVRVGAVLLGLMSGFGLAVYVVLWLLLPAEGEDTSIGARALADGRGLALAAAVVPVAIVVVAAADALNTHWTGPLAWPLVVAAAGVVLVWRNGSPAERAALQRAVRPLLRRGESDGRGRWWWVVARATAGVLLAAAGAAVLDIGHARTAGWFVGGVLLVLAAVVVVFGPWWLNLGRDLMLERQARLRAEERADLASRVHDSVLQTLAMIQRNAQDPQRVAQLARAQERELRSWLFEGRPPGSFDADVTTVADAVRRIQSDVEAAHGVVIDVVVVGDGPLDEGVEALLAAGREAVVNAARWSGAPTVSMYAEVEPARVSLFVRDRGRGFDRAAVCAERKGLSESIEGRMARAGGKAVVRTAPGEGTEVELVVTRAARAAR
jgi:signal transduction histidine kinase